MQPALSKIGIDQSLADNIPVPVAFDTTAPKVSFNLDPTAGDYKLSIVANYAFAIVQFNPRNGMTASPIPLSFGWINDVGGAAQRVPALVYDFKRQRWTDSLAFDDPGVQGNIETFLVPLLAGRTNGVDRLVFSAANFTSLFGPNVTVWWVNVPPLMPTMEKPPDARNILNGGIAVGPGNFLSIPARRYWLGTVRINGSMVGAIPSVGGNGSGTVTWVPTGGGGATASWPVADIRMALSAVIVGSLLGENAENGQVVPNVLIWSGTAGAGVLNLGVTGGAQVSAGAHGVLL